jgi:uncharacterized membrane protein YeaQ/YmgE (transglycosylase-associated protein family)
MTWTVTNFIIQVIAGIVGGHAAAAAVHDHKFGALGHTIAGAAGGAITGLLLQSVVATVEAGMFGTPSTVELAVGEAVVGFAAGALTTLIVGLFKKEAGQRKLG